MKTARIPIDKIQPDPNQPRKLFDATALQELAGSIRENGLIQPITVRAIKGGYMIIAGDRRWRAHGLLVKQGCKAFASIDANVRHVGDKLDVLVKQIAENVNRADLEPMEEAKSYGQLIDLGMTSEQIATKLGLAKFRVDWRLQLLNLSPPIARLVESGQIDRQVALEAARLPHHRDQTRIVQMFNRGDLVGWKAVRSATEAILNQTSAADLFGEAAPAVSRDDVAVLNTMERRVEAVAGMVAHGWRDGQCVIASKVSPDRASVMADKIAAIRGHLVTMERELRNVSAQAKIVLAS